MNENKHEVSLVAISTTEASFKREIVIDFDTYQNAKNNLEINLANTFDKENFGVYLTLILKQEYNDKVIVEIRVTTTGVFKPNVELPEKYRDNFCDVNAPAIIFPFVREIVADLSMKGGLPPILLQPINFIELAKNKSGGAK